MQIIVSPGSVVNLNPFFRGFIVELEGLGNQVVPPSLKYLFSADVFHVHFPEHKVSVNKNLFRALVPALAMLAFMIALRLRGCPVVHMVHEVVTRGYHPRLRSAYMACVRRLATGYIFLSKTSHSEFNKLYPKEQPKPALEIMHPSYVVRFSNNSEKTAIRKKLGIKPGEFLVAYLGDVGAHKNPWALHYVPDRLDDGRSTVLLLGGKSDRETKGYEKTITHPRCIHIDRRMPDDELEGVLQAADVVFLPYRQVWNSGFLFLVLSSQQKALTSNRPVFIEMKGHFGDRWITTFDLSDPDQHDLAGVLLGACHMPYY
jgi:beta-1,4-mannosyltransferase